MNIKTKLIHLLGGVTRESISESIDEATKRGFIYGRVLTLNLLKQIADANYGVHADQWCDIMYREIDNRLSAALDKQENNPLDQTRKEALNILYKTHNDTTAKN